MNSNQPTQQQGRQLPPQQNQPTQGVPYVGSKISLISKSEIRYEGILYNIDPSSSTVALQDVRMFGTEGRREGDQIPPMDKVYNFIVFKGSDIKDLTVCEPPKQNVPPQNAFPPQFNQGFMPMVHPSQYGYNFPPNPNYFGYGSGSSGAMPPHGGLYYPPQNQQPFFPPGPQNQPPFSPFGAPQQAQEDKKQPTQNGAPVNQPPQVENKIQSQQHAHNDQPKATAPLITQPQQQQQQENKSGSEPKSQQQRQPSQQRKNFPGNNRGGRGGARSTGSKTSDAKPQFNEEFDFEGNLKKLDKQSVLKEIQEKAGSESDQVSEVVKPVVQPAYNRDNFFDSLSTDNAEKSAKRMTRQEREDQKKLNLETFGESGIQSRTGFRGGRGGNRGGSRGRGDRGSRGRGSRGRDNRTE